MSPYTAVDKIFLQTSLYAAADLGMSRSSEQPRFESWGDQMVGKV